MERGQRCQPLRLDQKHPSNRRHQENQEKTKLKASYYIAIDLGGTQIRAALADQGGRLLARFDQPTQAQTGPEAVLNRIVATVDRVWTDRSQQPVTAAGVSAPGPLNPWTGVVYTAPNLPGWDHYPLKEKLEARLGVPVQLGNDANLGALGELHFGAGQGVSDMIYMTISTGIGGGVICGGKLLLGADGIAGEIGHQIVVAGGPVCSCGNRGCLEALASGRSIARNAINALQQGRHSLITELVNGKLEAVTARIVAQAAAAGDPLSQHLLDEAGYYIGIGIANLLNLFNPRRVVLGGGVTRAGELLFAPIRRAVQTNALPIFTERVEIVPAALGDDVVLYGALALVMT